MPSATGTSPSRKRTTTATKRLQTTSRSRSPSATTRTGSYALLEEGDLENLGISPPDQSQQHAGVLVLAPITPATTLKDAASIYLQYVDVNVALGRLAVGTARTRRYGLRHLSETLLNTRLGDLQRSEIIRWHDTVFMTPGTHGQALRSVEFSARKALQALLGASRGGPCRGPQDGRTRWRQAVPRADVHGSPPRTGSRAAILCGQVQDQPAGARRSHRG